MAISHVLRLLLPSIWEFAFGRYRTEPKAIVKKPSKIHIIFVTCHDHFELIYPTDAIGRNDMIQIDLTAIRNFKKQKNADASWVP